MSSIPPSSAALPFGPSSGGNNTSASFPLSSSFRRRMGRAASPPTWTWYEHITPSHDDEDDEEDSDEDGSESGSGSGTGSDDDELEEQQHDNEHGNDEQDEHTGPGFEMDLDDVTPSQPQPVQPPAVATTTEATTEATPTMDICATGTESDRDTDSAAALARKLAKGKQRAVPPSPATSSRTTTSSSTRRRARKTQPVPEYRPILTIHRSQGFVWNQDVFVPSYIKDRYVTSTSPPIDLYGSLSSSPGAHGSPFDPIEVVEIRVTGRELDGR